MKHPKSETTPARDQAEARLPLEVVLHTAAPFQPQPWLRRRLGLILLVLLLLGGGSAFYYREAVRVHLAPRPDRRVAQALPAGPQSVFALGRLEPEGEVIAVAAPSASGAGEARVEMLHVREGDAVKQGAVLAVLDNEARLKAAVLVAANTAEQARLRIDRTKREVDATRAQLEAALHSAESRLAHERMQRTRYEQLARKHVATQEEYDQRELAVTTAQDTVREARAKLDRYQVTANGELVDLTLSRQEFATAQASLHQARTDLAQAYVRAPIDGTILRLRVRPGERIGQTPLLDMGATQRMVARIEVYESDVPRLRLGQAVRLTASPLETPLAGTLERMTHLVRRQEIVDALPAANTDARVVEVWVRLTAESLAAAAQFVNLQVRAEFLP